VRRLPQLISLKKDAAEAVHTLDELKNLSADEIRALLEAERGLSA
jgi:hypothetical protein